MHRNERLERILQLDPGGPLGGRETRGLDTPFARETHVVTALDRKLLAWIEREPLCRVILCGNPGDGKTALIDHALQAIEAVRDPLAPRPNQLVSFSPSLGRPVQALFDGSAAGVIHAILPGETVFGWASSQEHLDQWFESAAQATAGVMLLAINDGRLLEHLQGLERPPTRIEAALRVRFLDGRPVDLPGVHLVDLNRRSILEEEGLVGRMLRAITGSPEAWAACDGCPAQATCPARLTARLVHDEASFERMASRLRRALLLLERTARLHVTIRELRALLAAGLFGGRTCAEVQQATVADHAARAPWNGLFHPIAPVPLPLHEQLAHLDPAGEDTPGLDRRLLAVGVAVGFPPGGAPPAVRDLLQRWGLLRPPSDAAELGRMRRFTWLLGALPEGVDDLALLGVSHAGLLDPDLRPRDRGLPDPDGGAEDRLSAVLEAFARMAGFAAGEAGAPGGRDVVLLGDRSWVGGETRFGWRVPASDLHLGRSEHRSRVPVLQLDKFRLPVPADLAEALGRLAEGTSPRVPEVQPLAEAIERFAGQARQGLAVRERVARHPGGGRWLVELTPEGRPPFRIRAMPGPASESGR